MRRLLSVFRGEILETKIKAGKVLQNVQMFLQTAEGERRIIDSGYKCSHAMRKTEFFPKEIFMKQAKMSLKHPHSTSSE
jgi:hypothetical protein